MKRGWYEWMHACALCKCYTSRWEGRCCATRRIRHNRMEASARHCPDEAIREREGRARSIGAASTWPPREATRLPEEREWTRIVPSSSKVLNKSDSSPAHKKEKPRREEREVGVGRRGSGKGEGVIGGGAAGCGQIW